MVQYGCGSVFLISMLEIKGKTMAKKIFIESKDTLCINSICSIIQAFLSDIKFKVSCRQKPHFKCIQRSVCQMFLKVYIIKFLTLHKIN